MFDQVYRTCPTPKIVEVVQEFLSEIKIVKQQTLKNNTIETLEMIEEQPQHSMEKTFETEEAALTIDQRMLEENDQLPAENSEISQQEILEKIELFSNIEPSVNVFQESSLADEETKQSPVVTDDAYTKANSHSNNSSLPQIVVQESSSDEAKEAEQPLLLADATSLEAEEHPDNFSSPEMVIQESSFDEAKEVEQLRLLADDGSSEAGNPTDNSASPGMVVQENSFNETKEAEQLRLLADDAPPEAEDHPDNPLLPRTVVQKNLFDEYWKAEQPLIVIDDVYPAVDDHTDNPSPHQISVQEGEEKEAEPTSVIIDHAYPQVDCHSDNDSSPHVSIQGGEEKKAEPTPVTIDHAYPQVDCHSDNDSSPHVSIQEGEEKAAKQSMVATEISHIGIDCHPNHACPPCVSVTSSTVTNCESTLAPDTPVIIAGALTKIPVVLAQFQVQLNINARIDLPQPALEIKEILNSTKLIQSLLLLEPGVVSGSGDLFLKGFIRKNISYATSGCSNKAGVCGDIHHCTVDVPFACTTTVTYDTPPVLPVSNSMAEFQFFRTQKLHGQFAEKDHLLSSDMSEHNQVSVEYFNELPYCELISSKIVQYDEFLNRQKVNQEAPFEERLFTRIEEKMILTLTVKLLQKQSVQIPPAPGIRYLDTSDDTSLGGNESFDLFELADSKAETIENHVNEKPQEAIEETVIIDKDIGVVTEKSYQATAKYLGNQEQEPGG